MLVSPAPLHPAASKPPAALPHCSLLRAHVPLYPSRYGSPVPCQTPLLSGERTLHALATRTLSAFPSPTPATPSSTPSRDRPALPALQAASTQSERSPQETPAPPQTSPHHAA